jgi:PAS domain S-box-containing protein
MTNAQTHMERDDKFQALADDAPVMIFVSSEFGDITWLNRRWLEFTGRPLAAHLGQGWTDDVHPDDADRLVGGFGHAFEAREPFEAEMRLRRADGRFRWMLTRASPRHDVVGAFAGYVGTCTDITDRRNAESTLRLLAAIGDAVSESFDMDATLQRIARLAVPDFADLCTIAVADPDGRVRRVAIAHTDRDEEALLRNVDDDAPLSTDDGSALAEVTRTGVPLYRPLVDAPGPDEPWPKLADDDRGRSLLVAPLVGRHGVLGACAMVSWSRAYTADDVVLVEEVAQRCAAAVDNAVLFRESEDRRERLALLANIGEQLASTLDLGETTRLVLDRVVPVIADFGEVVLAERGRFHRVAVRHVDRDVERAFHDHIGEFVDLDSQLPVARAMRSGAPVLIETVPSASPRRNHGDEAFGPSRALGAQSLLAVPLRNNGTIVGGLVFGYGPSGRHYSVADVPLALDIARRVTLAVDRARTFVAERRTAETLQRSLLPDDLPDLPTIGLCARYVPGERAEVGGDWYDVLSLSHGRLGVVIGDVAGHGVRAAAVMGQLRNALRAFAGEGYAPAALVERLNRFVFDNGPSDMATLCYAVVDPATGTFQAVSAGHPPPVVVSSVGEARWLHGVGGPPIGADSRSRYRISETALSPGDTVIMYTDGLIERRRESLDVGLQRLLDAVVSAPRPADLGRTCDYLTSVLLPEGGTDDDVAVLSVRYVGNAPGAFRWRRAARASELGTMRRVMSAWLEAAGVPREDIMLIAVAVSEATTNSIEHAYGKQEGWVEVEARRDDDDVVIMVRDGGRWRAKAQSGGGRGLGLIGRLMDEFELRRSDQGTEVWMRRSTQGRNGG